eukprot:284157-Chlamydomonas_euryale.AAC.4
MPAAITLQLHVPWLCMSFVSSASSCTGPRARAGATVGRWSAQVEEGSGFLKAVAQSSCHFCRGATGLGHGHVEGERDPIPPPLPPS